MPETCGSLEECRVVLHRVEPAHDTDERQPRPVAGEIIGEDFDLAVDFDLPIAMPGDATDLGFPARSLAAEEGIVMPDHAVRVRPGVESRDAVIEALADLPIGVTELQVRPAVDVPEHRAMTPNWPAGVGDAHLVTHDWSVRAALHRSGATMVGFADLRDAQRRARRA